jgi:hypothetical protein
MIIKIEDSLDYVSQKHYWLTQYIFWQITPSSGNTIDVSPRAYAKVLWINFIII